jgi:hypothetical protein
LIGESAVQILLGEAKTRLSFDGDDVRKLSTLAAAIPKDLAQVFIMFSKLDAFSAEEIALAKTLNSEGRQRVILWSRDELEPYYAYSRSKERLQHAAHGSTLSGMAAATKILWLND